MARGKDISGLVALVAMVATISGWIAFIVSEDGPTGLLFALGLIVGLLIVGMVLLTIQRLSSRGKVVIINYTPQDAFQAKEVGGFLSKYWAEADFPLSNILNQRPPTIIFREIDQSLRAIRGGDPDEAVAVQILIQSKVAAKSPKAEELLKRVAELDRISVIIQSDSGISTVQAKRNVSIFNMSEISGSAGSKHANPVTPLYSPA